MAIKDQDRKDSKMRSGQSGRSKKSSSSRGKAPRREEDFSPKETGYENDVEWYFRDPVLAQISTNLNFTWPSGFDIPLSSNGGSQNAPFLYIQNPGIMTLQVFPSVGASQDPSSAVNVAARGIYTTVRAANSGARNYDATDLMLYLIANADLYSYIVYLTRIHDLASTSNQLNFNLPTVALEANYVDPVDLRDHLDDFRFGLQQLIVQAARNAVPNQEVMPYFARRAFIYKNLYCEGTSFKDQMYMYVPGGFYKFGLDEQGAGALDIVGTMFNPGAKNKVKDLIDFGFELLGALISERDFGNMSGDIMKAYPGKLITLNPLAVDGILTPVFSIEVLEQFKNATPQGLLRYGGIHQVVTENVDSYLQHQYWTTPFGNGTTARGDQMYQKLMTVHQYDLVLGTTTDKVDPSLVMVNSRLMSCYDPRMAPQADPDIPTKTMLALITGSEVVGQCYIWGMSNGTTFNYAVDGYQLWDCYQDDPTSGNGPVHLAKVMQMQSRFEFAPVIYQAQTTNATTSAINYTGIHWDLDNYAVMPINTLKRLHDTAIMSMFNVPVHSQGLNL